MARVLYIAGLEHSGSTLLDLMLSGHSKITGAGEVSMLTEPVQRLKRIEQADTKLCSCGQRLTLCSFWKPLIDACRITPALPFHDALKVVLNQADSILAPGTWLSDSSKNISGLRQWLSFRQNSLQEFKVIHLVRDVRSWTASYMARKQLKGMVAAFRSMRFWKSSVESELAAFRAMGIEFLPVGYEELCLFPRATLNRICAFLNLPFAEGMLQPARGGGHVATGNPMRLDEQKSNTTYYDHRWFFRRDLAIPYSFLSSAARLNNQCVYPVTLCHAGAVSFVPPRDLSEPLE